MIADVRRNENPTLVTANQDLRQSLKAVQAQAEALISSMDVLIRQISFEGEEFKTWNKLREALTDFQTLEVNPGVPVMVMIPPERLTKLNMAYGPKVGDAINCMIEDLTKPNEAKQNIISVANMKKLNDVYGACTAPAINRIIGDLIIEADKKAQDKPQQKSRFRQALDQIQPKVQPVAQ